MFRFLSRYMKLTEEEVSLVRTTNRVKTFKKNEVVKSMLSESRESFFVLSGCVYSIYGGHEEDVIGEFFFTGDPVLIPMAPTESASLYELRCIGPTTLAVSSDDEVERLVREWPRFERVCRLFAEEKLAQSMRFHDHLRRLSPLEKYLFVLKEKRQLIDHVPQHLVANYLGIAPETLSRVRRQMITDDLDPNQ